MADLGRARATDFVRIADEFGDDELSPPRPGTRSFVDNEVLPVITGYWERAEFPFDLVRRMGELGLVSDGIDYPGSRR